MKNIILILLIPLIWGCERGRLDDEQESFNSRASLFTLKDFDSHDLRPLDVADKCLLRAYIANDLDSLNDWKLTSISGCRVRNYYVSRLELGFSIIKDLSGNFFLVSLPHLNEYVYDMDRHYVDQESIFLLRDSAIVKLQSPLLTSLLAHGDLCKDCRSAEKIEMAGRLIREIFPEAFRQKMQVGEVKKELQFRVKSGDLDSVDYNHIVEVVDGYQSNDSDSVKSEICYLPWVGHLIFTIQTDKNGGSVEPKCTIHLIPLNKRRARMARSDIAPKYVECFSEK